MRNELTRVFMSRAKWENHLKLCRKVKNKFRGKRGEVREATLIYSTNVHAYTIATSLKRFLPYVI